MKRARRVSGAIKVLRARVAEVDGVWVDGGAVARFRFVVDDCCVRACGRNCVEGEADKVLLFSIVSLVG